MSEKIAYVKVAGTTKVGIIDADLAPKILKYSWHLIRDKYIAGKIDSRSIYLSKYIAELAGYDSENVRVHYKNKDTLDNRLENLDIKWLSTGIPGLYFNTKRKSWYIQVVDDETGSRYNLAEFRIKEDALAYYKSVCAKEPKKYLQKYLVSKGEIIKIQTKLNNLVNLSVEDSELQKLSQQAQELIVELQSKLGKIEEIVNQNEK